MSSREDARTGRNLKQHNPRRRHSLHRTRVSVNCYDLLPPGYLSSFLWHVGSSMLHTGVVIEGKEYAFGGHNKPGVSGVYYTHVGTAPPGGIFRCEILQGFTFHTPKEIKRIIREASHKFQGAQWGLLTNNCNHFTHHLCKELTGHPAPSWINRAASIGVMIPCIVPKAWIAPPDVESADGDLIESNNIPIDEGTAMLPNQEPELHWRYSEDETSNQQSSLKGQQRL